MPASQRFQVPLLLLILALPVVAIAAGLGLQSGSLWRWTGVSLLLGIAGLLSAIRGLSLGPKPGQPFDAQRFERQGRSMVLAFAFIIGVVALLVAATISRPVGLFIVGVAAVWVLLWTPPSLRRVEAKSSVLIQRDPATVFSFVADAHNLPLYVPTVLSVEKLTEGPIGPGTQFHSKMQLTPATTTEAIAQIVDYEPNRRMTSRVISGATPNLDVITITPADSGTLLSARQIMAAQQSSWTKLKQILENTESDPAKT